MLTQLRKYVGVVAYGVGITEALPVAEAELKKGDADSVRLLWASRTMADTFLHNRTEALEKACTDGLTLVRILSRDKCGGCLHARIDSERASQRIPAGVKRRHALPVCLK